MKAITVCVEYDDLLALVLPTIVPHVNELLVVTAPQDESTMQVAGRFPSVRIYVTDAFYRHGAPFNKGLALEEGFDILGREGWLCVFDADTVWPAEPDFSSLEEGCLHVPRRRMCPDPRQYHATEPFGRWPLVREIEHAGYCQIFHASDRVLRSRPWYPTDWRHAGGCDSDFQDRWPARRRKWLPWEVLHLGPHGRNWHGRSTPKLDGTIPTGHAERARLQREMLQARRRHGYKLERIARSESDG